MPERVLHWLAPDLGKRGAPDHLNTVGLYMAQSINHRPIDDLNSYPHRAAIAVERSGRKDWKDWPRHRDEGGRRQPIWTMYYTVVHGFSRCCQSLRLEEASQRRIDVNESRRLKRRYNGERCVEGPSRT